MKYYAVRKGKKPGIYSDWSSAEKQVKGFSGAVYKSFSTKEEAEQFIVGLTFEEAPSSEVAASKSIKAYVDGSYFVGRKQYGSGVVILNSNDEVLDTFSFKGVNAEYLAARNVAGEVEAAVRAIDYAQTNAYLKITIYHDYEGVEKWATEDWKANKPISKYYQSVIREARKSGLSIDFVKVEAHTGDEYNEVADTLAKEAITSGEVSELNVEKTSLLQKESEIKEVDFSKIEKSKTIPALNILYSENVVINEKELLDAIKLKWKSQKRKWNEIKNFKTVLVISKNSLEVELNLKDGTKNELSIDLEEIK